MRISTQHKKRDVEVEFGALDGGIDYSVPAWKLPDNVLYEATNFFYDIDSGRLMTRPGLVKVSSSGIGDAIYAVYPCTVNDIRYIIVSTQTRLYYFSGGTFTLIGNLAASTRTPQFASYKEMLYIASGGALQKWDGTTLSNVTEAPNCSLVVAKSARLFVNDVDDPDTVQASDVQLDDVWGYPGGASFQAGWGDGDSITAMRPIGDDLLIFKGNKVRSTMILQGVYPDWNLLELSKGSSIVGPNAVAKLGSQVFGLDKDGLNNVQAVATYGDYKLDPVGGPVVGPLTRQLQSTAFMAGWPDRAIFMVFPSQDLSTAYALHYSTSSLIPNVRWTRFRFGVPSITCAAYNHHDDLMYLAAKNGHLYTMNMEILAEMNTFQDDGSDYTQILRTKIVDPRGSKIIHKRSRFFFEALSSGTGTMYVFTQDGTWPQLSKDFTISPRLIDDFDEIEIDEMLMPVGMPDRSTVVRLDDRCRDNNLMLGVVVSSGALSVSRMDIDAAIVGRE